MAKIKKYPRIIPTRSYVLICSSGSYRLDKTFFKKIALLCVCVCVCEREREHSNGEIILTERERERESILT